MEYNSEEIRILKEASNSASLVVIIGYILGIGLSLFIQFFESAIINYSITTLIGTAIFYGAFYLANHAISRFFTQIRYFHFFITAFIFGEITHWGVNTLVFQQDYFLFSLKVFLINNTIFHLGEFYFVCLSHPRDLKWASFLINHSPAYNAAFVAALAEYIIGVCFPNSFLFYFHDNKVTILIGVVLCIFGHILRIGAQQTAKSNFNHIVQNQKKDDHVLVTHGIYSFSRHPSYLGFFAQSLGSQIILGNIFCFFAYTYVLFKFFLYRIVDEEHHLVKFFGREYLEYRERVPIRIPFIDYAMRKTFIYDD